MKFCYKKTRNFIKPNKMKNLWDKIQEKLREKEQTQTKTIQQYDKIGIEIFYLNEITKVLKENNYSTKPTKERKQLINQTINQQITSKTWKQIISRT